MKKSKGESQRIYWQQWLSSSGNKPQSPTDQNGGKNYSRRELITSSAAVRINPEAAKAMDVTQLLRDTLKLSSLDNSGGSHDSLHDSLVLVGTLYSLPKDYIQFEHEHPPRNYNCNDNDNDNHDLPKSSSDPFHVIKTLHPDDNPLTTRDRMMDHLRRLQDEVPSHTSTISPKVQWYFVPKNAGDPSSRNLIPSCIELDGYCTTMEDDDDDDGTQKEEEEEEQEVGHHNRCNGLSLTGSTETDETDTREGDDYYDLDLLLSRSPLMQESPVSSLTEAEKRNFTSCRNMTQVENDKLRRRSKELRRYFQLCYVQPSCSGYLLKQSTSDPHVWRRVFCTLTDDHLWYTTRVPYSPPSNSVSGLHDKNLPRMGKSHGRISLGRALLLEPSTGRTASPLSRVPHSLEVVSSRGTSHIFRAPTRLVQQKWIQSLTTKIMESFENSLLDHAELIVSDETTARNRRFTVVAMEPFCHESPSSTSADDSSTTLPADSMAGWASSSPLDNDSMYLSLMQASVLRLGMDVAEYRELCRHIQVLLPSKQPIVVQSLTTELNGSSSLKTTTSSSTPASQPLPGGSSRNGTNGKDAGRSFDAVPMAKVEEAWDAAIRLLNKAGHVALEVQQYAYHHHHHHQNRNTLDNHGPQQSHPLSLSHSLETHCRHIDYVLTGHHRPARAASPTDTKGSKGGEGDGNGGGDGGNNAVTRNGRPVNRQAPPPMDLFDFLLSELQSLVSTKM